jgi:hypothetical protein
MAFIAVFSIKTILALIKLTLITKNIKDYPFLVIQSGVRKISHKH